MIPPLVNDDTAALLALARAGDIAAFSRLMEGEQSRLLSQAHAFCGDYQQAQDLVQETMVAALPARHREVVRLCFYADASEAEIAAALGIASGTVKSRLHHALEKMRRMKEKLNRVRPAEH